MLTLSTLCSASANGYQFLPAVVELARGHAQQLSGARLVSATAVQRLAQRIGSMGGHRDVRSDVLDIGRELGGDVARGGVGAACSLSRGR